MRFNCCNATRPMLNKAQEAAANSGNKTTRSLVSAIKVNLCLQYIKYFLFEYYYTSFIKLVLKSLREFFVSTYFSKRLFFSTHPILLILKTLGRIYFSETFFLLLLCPIFLLHSTS